jgi:ribose operon repressor
MTTIKQVAEEAGVSKSTVSRYISQKGYVGDDAREKIKNAIKKLNYTPNVLAQSLKTKKNQMVGLLLPDISNPFFPRLVRGAESYLKDKGYRIMVGTISDHDSLEEYINLLLKTNAAGIITTLDFTKEFPNLTLPVVVVDRISKDTGYGVFSDNQLGGLLAAKAICNAGAKQVMIIKVIDDKAENIAERFEASLNYLRNKSLEIFIEESETFDFEKILKEAKENLKRNPNIDSIIAPSDIHAIAYIHEILAIGKKIPDDIQIIGYDDIVLSQFIYPSLSTIHQSSYKMGEQAAKLIYNMANNFSIDEAKIKLPVRYVERNTLRRK